jgi:hypothetical protein
MLALTVHLRNLKATPGRPVIAPSARAMNTNRLPGGTPPDWTCGIVQRIEHHQEALLYSRIRSRHYAPQLIVRMRPPVAVWVMV